MWPKCANSLPTSKINHEGNIISAPEGIKKLLAKEYKERLRTRPMRSDLSHSKKIKKQLFQMKMRLAEDNPSKNWTL